jgi:hypothetical protein
MVTGLTHLDFCLKVALHPDDSNGYASAVAHVIRCDTQRVLKRDHSIAANTHIARGIHMAEVIAISLDDDTTVSFDEGQKLNPGSAGMLPYKPYRC